MEYYVANSTNGLVLWVIKNQEQLEYSIEDREIDGVRYTILGLCYTFEHRFSIMQWLYINVVTKQLYEYDLANEALILFDK